MRNFLLLLGFSGLLSLQLTPLEAKARVEKTLRYTKNQSYNAALRFLRVDKGFNVIEKNLESGYLMFEYPTESSSGFTSGSIEVIEREQSVALVIQLPQLPHYHERMLASALLKKLRTDYGVPPREPRTKPKSPAAPGSPDVKKDPGDAPGATPKQDSP